MDSRSRVITLALAATLLASACSHGLRRFPLAEPMAVDPDRQPFSPEPADYFSGFYWDGADQMLFRPIARFWAVDPGGEAVNVNALDEVPDSSWYTNRMGQRPMSTEEVRRGACTTPPLNPHKPWAVVGAKPNGANPGFFIKGDDGQRYLVKFASAKQPERATAADVISSRLYYAMGMHTPCNQVVYFDPRILTIGEGATAEDAEGREVPLEQKHIDKVLSVAGTQPDGRYRAAASLFLPGRPIGPFRYEDVRADDPNDVVQHDDRRELRGSKVLAAWLNHFDSREQNTLDIWRKTEGGKGYIEHYIIDWGDTLGSMWGIDGISRRLGYGHYLDFNWLARDFFTLGVHKRPWEEAKINEVAGNVFAYFDAERFEADTWKPGYPNPAFLRMTERDAAWMARKLARLTEADLRAAIAEGKLSRPEWAEELYRILRVRWTKILRRYLDHTVSALDRPRIEVRAGVAELCLEDAVVISGLWPAELRAYGARAWDADGRKELAAPRTTHRLPSQGVGATAPGVCVALPGVEGAAADSPRYLIIDVESYTLDRPDIGGLPARLHLYHLGGADYRVVGLQRPYDSDPPSL